MGDKKITYQQQFLLLFFDIEVLLRSMKLLAFYIGGLLYIFSLNCLKHYPTFMSLFTDVLMYNAP